MAKTPGERFADAGELADAVRAATGPPGALPLLAQPLALMGELAPRSPPTRSAAA